MPMRFVFWITSRTATLKSLMALFYSESGNASRLYEQRVLRMTEANRRAAAKVAAQAPNGILRTPQTIQQLTRAAANGASMLNTRRES